VRERESRCHAEPARSTLRHASPHGPSHQVQQLMIRSTKTAPIPISASSTSSSSSTCRDDPHQSFICSPPSNNRHQTDWRKVSRSRALLPFRHVSFGLHTHIDWTRAISVAVRRVANCYIPFIFTLPTLQAYHPLQQIYFTL